jgi:putative hydrolase of the HAD superfamily
MRAMIKAIIFDLNGVFIQSPKLSERFREKFAVSMEEFLPALKEVMTKARMPNAGDSFRYWQPYLEKWGVSMSREEFFDFWFSQEKEIPELIEFVRKLKGKGLKLFILSNNFVERANYYAEHFPFLHEIFDRVYYSWQTGFVKPDPKAFELLMTENNLRAEECLYFDDSEHNVEVAQGLGINAHLFGGLEQVKSVLEPEGIKV